MNSFMETYYEHNSNLPNSYFKFLSEKELTPDQFIVLIYLKSFRYINNHRTSANQLSKKLNMHRDTITKSLRILCEKKLIRITKFDIYFFKVEYLIAEKTTISKTQHSVSEIVLKEEDGCTDLYNPPVQKCTPPCTEMYNPLPKNVQDPVQNCTSPCTKTGNIVLNIDNKEEIKKELKNIYLPISDKSAENVTTNNTALKESHNNLLPKSVMDLWNKLIANGHNPNLSAWKKLTKDRINLINKALKSDIKTLEDWESFIKTIIDSDFLTGRTGNQWPCSLEWCLKESHMTSILEGKYINKKALTKTDKILNIKNPYSKDNSVNADFTRGV